MVPLDATSESRHAIPLALTLELVHVDAPLAIGGDISNPHGAADRLPPNTVDETGRHLGGLATEIARVRHVAVETFVVPSADFARALADHATQTRPEFVVMTTHDHGRIERMLLGSVSEAFIRQVHAPVIVVKHSTETVSFSQQVLVRHILFTLDRSAFAGGVHPYVVTLAKTMGARVTTLTVEGPSVPAAPPGLSPLVAAHGARDAEELSAEAEAEKLRVDGITATSAVVTDHNPGDAITAYALAHDADLIAMATHGRRGLVRLGAGSVATQVLHHTRLPVLMYRPPAE